ncbi:glycosyltransferase [Biostraticola tofi]|uniref:Glycosyltransferase involved in cell wall biosynthesis n=1 Tax=Biostraticola tofi TaxID=466109 RepID=A0A4R3Z4T2_9GAMM|nr:glycosyltransferase [Biostraticola tofi]TCW00207.1 glycosyltransferase involved in cell wall biosynthesis [Biostraticola tofi]
MKQECRNIILLSTADWDNPFWTNKQHVAVDLAKRGNKILYIDSLGLRSPGLNKKDFTRIIKRIIKAIKPPRQVSDNIWVWSPITLPWNNYKLVRQFNRIFLKLAITFWSKKLSLLNPWLWTYNPLTTEFIDLKKYNKVIYHCVDEIKAQPGMPVNILERAEKDLVSGADIVFVTAPNLLISRKKLNDNTYYFSNVADFNHFSKAMKADTLVPTDLLEIKGPILGFIGAVSSYKVNFELLIYIAEQRPEWNIVIIGQVGEGDPSTDVAKLESMSNIYILGPRPYKDLPCYLKGFDVALLPNNINEYTDNMFPMKFFEYLAAGKPVVSVELKAIMEFEGIVKIGKNKELFLEAIEETLQGKVANLEDRISLASKYTYESRSNKMLNMIK